MRMNDNEMVFSCDVPGVKQEDFALPDYLDDSNLDAHLADGVLTIRVPKHAKAKPRRIQIGDGSSSKQLKE